MKTLKKIFVLALAVICMTSFSSCLKYTSNILEVTSAVQTEDVTTQYQIQTTEVSVSEVSTDAYLTTEATSDVVTTAVVDIPSTQAVVTEAPATAENTTAAVVTEAPSTEAAVKDPSTWSTAETLSFLTNAMNKTRAYTGNVSVRHTENFSFNVSNVTGGSAVKSLANKIIASVAAPSDETLNFSGGKAKNSEGETVPLLLPKKGNFSLDADGCTSVSASKSGENTVIKCTLIKESVDMKTVPKYNSSACGYLDINSIDLSVVTVTDFNIDYEGTTLTITINPDGYVTSAAYHVPLTLDASGKAVGITANVQADGYEDEVWTINW